MILEIQGLKKTIDSGDKPVLFNDVSGCIEESQITAVLGASGQGKSTLLRILARLDAHDEGDILLHNKACREWLIREWRRKVCYVAQFPVMLPGTVEDNLKTVSRLHRMPFDASLAGRLMESLHLDRLDWKKNAADLSGGEKQRLALIRSMLMRSELLLLDEVTASLDQHSKHAVERVLKEWSRQEGTAILWVTHDVQQAREHSSRVWFMGEGTLLEDCGTESFFQNPATRGGRRYLWGSEEEGAPRCPILP